MRLFRVLFDFAVTAICLYVSASAFSGVKDWDPANFSHSPTRAMAVWFLILGLGAGLFFLRSLWLFVQDIKKARATPK